MSGALRGRLRLSARPSPLRLADVLSRSVLAICALCAVTVAITMAALLSVLGVLQPAVSRTIQAQQALTLADRGMLDQETSLRGYLLSGDGEFLGPYRRGRGELSDGLRALDALAESDGYLRSPLAAMAQARQAWESGWARMAAVHAAGSPVDQGFLDSGRRLFDAYRVSETAVASTVTNQLEHDRSLQQGVLLAALLLDILIIAAVVVMGRSRSKRLQAAVAAPVDELLAGIARIRDGELAPPVPPREPLEMRQLGVGLGEMTASLAASRILADRRLDALHEQTEELRAAQEAAQSANQAKSAFLSRMSHELRIPLTAILGYSDLLQLARLEPEHQGWAQTIGRAGQHLLELIDDILDISRIEAGRLRLSIEPVGVGEVAAEVEALMRPLAAERAIAVVVAVGAGDGGGPVVLADHQRLKQVLLNLVSNAVKYNRPEGSVRISALTQGQRVLVSVDDTGRGIAPADLELLFNAFERLDAAESQIQGTGLGLALSRTLVEAMGGTISVRSTRGQGSSFTVELATPQAPPDLQAVALRAEARPPVEVTPASVVVLYVEDTAANITLVERVAAERPHVVVIPAVQGSLALELARAHPPALIILDYHLPDVDGAEVLRRLRADPQTATTPIVMLSADTTPGDVERLRAAGATEHLAKPAKPATLLALLDRYAPTGEGGGT